MKLSRRELLGLVGKTALVSPVLLAVSGLGSGCMVEKYDIEVSFKAQRNGSVLELTKERLHGIQSDQNTFSNDGQSQQAMYVYSVQNAWGEWIYEVNGNQINKNVEDCMVRSGDTVTWKGKFSK